MDDRLFDSIGTCGVPAPVGALRYNGSRETGFCQLVSISVSGQPTSGK